MPQLAGPLGAEPAHVPIVCPAAMVHAPVQQSPLFAQASPGCTQNDDAWQVPPEQRPEQHEALDVHALPIVLHVVLSGVHVWLVPHVWLQHWPFDVHGRLSEAQAG
jgi:hypothetical protein